MILLNLSSDDRAQLGGWLRRERDFLFAARACLIGLLTPHASGSKIAVEDDIEFIKRLQSSIRESDRDIILSEKDSELLCEVAQVNRHQNREAFWASVLEAITIAEGKG